MVSFCVINAKNFRMGLDIPIKKVILREYLEELQKMLLMKEPHTFNPSRFLDDQGNFVRNERVIPFGIGNFYHDLGCF